MTPYGLVGRHDARSRHRWLNRFQTALLVLTLVGIAAAAGSLLFGIGWGLAGICPGPGVVAAALGSGGALLFTGAMLVGMALFALWRRR